MSELLFISREIADAVKMLQTSLPQRVARHERYLK